MNYVGRWLNPDQNPEIIVMDLYGFNGKPWDITKLDAIIQYDDVKYWVKKFKEYYEKVFKDVCKFKKIHELYQYVKKYNL
jgi:hypothetical protein